MADKWAALRQARRARDSRARDLREERRTMRGLAVHEQATLRHRAETHGWQTRLAVQEGDVSRAASEARAAASSGRAYVQSRGPIKGNQRRRRSGNGGGGGDVHVEGYTRTGKNGGPVDVSAYTRKRRG